MVVGEMRVTFDRQVLGKVIFPGKRKKDPDHACLEKINAALRAGRLQGFICESVGTLEAIAKDKRATYFANRTPKSQVQTARDGKNVSLAITFTTDHDRHPGLDERLIENLQGARALGMRLLYVPCFNIQLPAQFLNDQPFYESRLFETQVYADCFADVSAAIEARGVGAAVITAIAKCIQEQLPVSARASQSGLQLLPYAKNEAERTAIMKAIAEWADGDLVASHIASGNDLLCSEDQGRSAGGPSIFDDANRVWLKSAYHVEFASIPELAAKIT